MTVNQAHIESALKDLDCPASKEAIMAHAEGAAGSSEVLKAVQPAVYPNIAAALRSVYLPGTTGGWPARNPARLRRPGSPLGDHGGH